MAAFDVAVIGLGAMGSAALYHLARQGVRAIGLEQALPGHEGGSSHGESRIIRLAQFENPAYTPLVARAYELWRALEAESGAQVIVDTGILEAGPEGAPIVEGSLRAARMHGLAHERLTPAQANARFPAFRLPDHWTAVFQPAAGIVRADNAIALHMRLAEAGGARVRLRARVLNVEPAPDGVRLTLGDGETVTAGRIVVTAGPWIGRLIPELAPHLILTRQPVGWFDPADPAAVTPDRMPVFVTEDGPEAIYGFPDFAGTGVKAASHRPGRRLATAYEAEQDATEAELEPVARALRDWLPGAAGALRAARTCIYSSTPDEEFVIDRAPADPRIVFASACSGHGFKFASVFGEILAGMATSDETPAAVSAFTLSRFARM